MRLTVDVEVKVVAVDRGFFLDAAKDRLVRFWPRLLLEVSCLVAETLATAARVGRKDDDDDDDLVSESGACD